MMSTSQPLARTVRGRDGRGGGLAAPGAGRDEQVRFFVLQVRDPFPAAGQGGQVDLVGGQVVPVEPGQLGGCGRVGPGGLVRAERAGQVAAQVPADDLVDVLLPGGVGVPGGRVGQRDLRVLVGGEPGRDVQPAAGPVALVGAEVLAELEVDRAGHPPFVPPPLEAGPPGAAAGDGQHAEHDSGDQRAGGQPGRGRDREPADQRAFPAGPERPPGRLAGGQPAGHPADHLGPRRQERGVGAALPQRRPGREPARQPRPATRRRGPASRARVPRRPGTRSRGTREVPPQRRGRPGRAGPRRTRPARRPR